MKFIRLAIVLFIGISFAYTSSAQVKKIPAYIDGKMDTLDFPSDFRNENGIEIGQNFVSFKLANIEGKEVDYDQIKDKVLVLNFWFVGCKGCKQEEPYLKKMVEEITSDKVEFISFCESSEGRIRNYLKKNEGLGYDIISISKKYNKENFKVRKFATHMIVVNGKVVENFSFPLTTDDEITWFKDQILGYL